ncbi:MAG: hypothetical protein ACXAC7_07520 [Candidatus Hodarchaeales archaeon]|jgi:DNA repair protein RadA
MSDKKELDKKPKKTTKKRTKKDSTAEKISKKISSTTTKKGSVYKNVDDPLDSINLLLTFKDDKGKRIFTPKIVNSLRSANISGLSQIAAFPDLSSLTDIGGIGEKIAQKIWEEVARHFGIDAQTALGYETRLKKTQLRCSTGSKALDTLLNGGIATKQITEFYGEPQMGKTQLCYSLAVYALIDRTNGGFYEIDKIDPKQKPRVYWIDTEFSFNPDRIREILANRFPEENPDDILDDILIVQPVTSDEVIREVNKVFLSPDNVSMLIIDSLLAPFRSEALISFSQLNPRQQKIQQLLGIIKRGMKVRNMSIILTNQVTTKISISGPMGGPPQQIAAGGMAVAHTVTNRIRLKRATRTETKSRSADIEIRKAIVEDSPFLPDASALFVLNDKGIDDFSSSIEKNIIKPLTGDSEAVIEYGNPQVAAVATTSDDKTGVDDTWDEID